MKKTIEKEIDVCDECGDEQHVYYKCKHCGIDHCWDCREEHGEQYAHSVHCSGSGDGYYCNACDNKLRDSKANALYNSYQGIQHLRKEENMFYVSFKERKNMAESKLQNLLKAEESE